jgi:hypothetical protein
MIRNRAISTSVWVAVIVLSTATMASAVVRTRGSSGNGVDSNAQNWMLLGRIRDLKLSNAGKTATMRREIVCLNQDVESALISPVPTLTGSCDSGAYLFVFQFQSSSANLSMVIGHLAGFDPSNPDNFGVMICDSPNNTIELCTNDPTITHIPNISTVTTSNSVTFTVPNSFPSYPAGTAQQGRGLTFFVITHQTNPLPLGLPTIAIH